jgi:hypothetical protein
MPFLCPECSSPQRSLKIKAKIELPPDSRSDEITLQIVVCSQCRFAGIAVYEESRRGALDSESFTHIGYRVSARDVTRLRRMIQRCPEPRNWRCKCPVHQELGAQDSSGRWNGLKDVPYEGEFELRL